MENAVDWYYQRPRAWKWGVTIRGKKITPSLYPNRDLPWSQILTPNYTLKFDVFLLTMPFVKNIYLNLYTYIHNIILLI